MNLTISEIGGLSLLAFAAFHYLGIFTVFRAILAFFGTVVVGSSGFLGHIVLTVGTWAQHVFASLANWAIGVPLGAGLAILTGIILAHDLHPKNKAGVRTGLLAVIFGAFVVAGIAGIPALAGLRGLILQLAANAQTALRAA